MTEGLPVFGLTMSRPQPDGLWYLIFPVRKDTTARDFSIEAVENAAKIAMYEAIPEEWELDKDAPVTIRWCDEHPAALVGGPEMVALHITARLKERAA